MRIESFFDQVSATVTYIVIDTDTMQCAIIDSVHDFDLNSGRLTSNSAEKIIQFVTENALTVEWILETHVHADHLTAAHFLKEKLGGKIGIGENVKKVLAHWIPIFNTGKDTSLDATQFDRLFSDGEQFSIGNLEVSVIHTPGHTPDSISYLINDAIFVGDTIFMPYVGTARTDFPGGNAKVLYQSIQKIFALHDETRIFTCHDYPPGNQKPAWECTVREQKKNNVMINSSVTQNEFIAARNKKDLNKSVPNLLLPSIQTNLRAGKLGDPESNDVRYIKIPINKI